MNSSFKIVVLLAFFIATISVNVSAQADSTAESSAYSGSSASGGDQPSSETSAPKPNTLKMGGIMSKIMVMMQSFIAQILALLNIPGLSALSGVLGFGAPIPGSGVPSDGVPSDGVPSDGVPGLYNGMPGMDSGSQAPSDTPTDAQANDQTGASTDAQTGAQTDAQASAQASA